MSSLLRKLQNKDILSSSEVIVADYLIENYRDLPNLSTRELAKKTFTSSAAIVRFCQKMGFEGYTDFKLKFLTEIMKYGNEVQAQIISEQDTINDIMKKVREINIDAINEAYNMLTPALLSRVLKLFNRSMYIDFYAIGSFLDFAKRMADTLTFVNKYPTVSETMALQYLQAHKVPKNHLGFFISPSGENRMLIDIAKLLKRQSCPSVLITASPNSTLAGLVNEYFTVKIGDNVEDLGPLVFLTSAKYITDTLLAALITQTNYQEAIDKEVWFNETFHSIKGERR